MGKIIGLGGGGYIDGEMLNVSRFIFECAEKEKPAFLFLPTASFDEYDENSDVLTTFRSYGCKIDILLLTDETLTKDEIREKILSADIIYADGGNLRFMMNTFIKTGADAALKEAYEKGTVLSGISSGMMCWFAQGYDDCDDGEFAFVDCLSLLPYVTCPHFENGRWPTFETAVKGNNYSGLAMENGAAFVYIDGKTSVMNGKDGGMIYLFDKDKNHAKEIFGGVPQKE